LISNARRSIRLLSIVQFSQEAPPNVGRFFVPIYNRRK
jgi:hypothetical protein